MRAPPISSSSVAVDLFCGCGGLTVGLKRAGFSVIGALDNDETSLNTYRANHPEVHVMDVDIRGVDPSDFKHILGLSGSRVDLVAGCPPCQGFSSIRTLNGSATIDDPRNDLLLVFLRFVKALRPRAVMLENVPGLEAEGVFTQFCDGMKASGYLGEHLVLDAANFGVPQRRRRLVYLAGLGKPLGFADPSSRIRTVRDTIGNMPIPGSSGDPIHDFPENRSRRIRELIKSIPKDGGSRTDLPEKKQLACHSRCNGFKDVYGRMRWDDVSPTITSGCFNPSKGRFLHPDQDRAITMREAALLQGFPRRYVFKSTSKVSVASMIGNAFPPPFSAALGKRISEST